MLAIAGSHAVQAQAPTISYPAPAENITRAYGQGNLTVKLVFNGSCSGTQVKVAFPATVTYIPGTVSKTGGSGSLAIAQNNIADLSNPVFNINGPIATGDEITFTLARRAACGNAATGKDSIYVTTGGGCTNGSEVAGTMNTYNLYAPALSVTPAASVNNAFTGTTATRTTTIVNGGNGPTDTVQFYIVYPGGTIVNTSGTNAITANGVSFTPGSANGDTLFYKIYGTTIFGGDNLLSNGETVTITEPVRVVKCGAPANATTYGAGWGGCQTATGTSSVTMEVGVPVPGIISTDSVLFKACTPGIVKAVVSNMGRGGNAGAMYNVKVNFGLSDQGEALQITGTGDGEFISNPTLGAAPGIGTSLICTTVGVVTNGNGYYEASMSQFTTDPDGPGGLADLDGDGAFDDLPPGESIAFYFNRNYINSNLCPRAPYAEQASVTASYTNMCETPFTTLPINARSTFRHLYASQVRTNTVQPQVFNGVPFAVNVKHSSSFSVPVSPTVDSLYLTLTLPAGVSYIPGTVTYRGVALAASDVVVNGNNITFRRKAGVVNTGNLSTSMDFDFQLVYDCTGGGSVSIPFEMYYVNSRDCGDIIHRLYCDAIKTSAVCPAPCTGGMANAFTKTERTTLGWTSADMTTRVSPASIPAEQLTYVMSYDSVRITNTAKQSAVAYNNIHFNFELDKVAGQNTLTFASGTYYHRSASTGTITSAAIPAPANLSTATHTQWDWNLTGLGGLPATLTNGDSVWIEILYQVARPTNELYGIVPTYAPNANSYFYSNNTAASREYCLGLIPNLKFIGQIAPTPNMLGSNATLIGCTGAIPAVYYNSGYSSGAKNIFNGEFRPSQYVDSMVYILPDGISYDPSYTPFMSRHSWTSKYEYLATNWNIAPPVINGNRLTFINDGTWPISELTTAGSQAHSRIYFKLTANCAARTTTGPVPFQMAYYGKDFYYAQQVPAVPMNATLITNASTTNLGIDGTKRPSLTVQNNTGVIQGVLASHFWDVTIANPSSQTAPYTWFSLEKPATSGIVIDSVKQNTATLAPAATYGATGNTWYQLSSSGLPSGDKAMYRVYFHYTNCNADSIQVTAGWNCTGYPTDPASYACTAASTWLKIVPQQSQVQLSVLRQPGNESSIDLCTTDSVLLVVNSAMAANLVQPYVTFFPPAGVALSATVQVEYPLASGNYQPAAISAIAGGGYKIDLSAHTGIGAGGMLGAGSCNPSFVPLSGDRQAKIKIDYTTNCGFSSGTSFVFNAYANRPCGITAIGDGISAATRGPNINGVIINGSAGIALNLTGSSTLTCGNTISIGSSIVPTSVAVQAGDTIVYTLPAGSMYAGNLTSGFTAVSSGQAVKISMPEGSPAGTAIAYSFDIAAQSGGCGSGSISAAFQRSIAPLSCNGVPCASSTAVLAGTSTDPITIGKPVLNLVNVVQTGGKYAAGSSYTADITVNNTSNLDAAAGTYAVEVFCGGSSTPFTLVYFPAAVPANSTATAPMTFLVPMSTANCVNGVAITYKIRPLTGLGTTQCLCSETSFTPAMPLPAGITDFQAMANHCDVQLSWKYGGDMNRIAFVTAERSTDGSLFTPVTTPEKNINTYTDAATSNGNHYYRLAVTYTSGELKYTESRRVTITGCGNADEVRIYPNPARTSIQVHTNSTSVFELIDAYGRKVMSGTLQMNKANTLDVSAYPNGIYLLRISNDNGISNHQLQVIR